MRTVQVTLELPVEEYRALTRIAAAKGVQVHTLLEAQTHKALTAPPRPVKSRRAQLLPPLHPDVEAEFRALHAAGLTDSAISAALAIPRRDVCNYRHKYDLARVVGNGRPRQMSL